MICKRFLTVFSVLCTISIGPLVCAQQTQTVRVGLMTGIGRTTSMTISCTAPFEVLDSSTDSVVTTVSAGSITFLPGGKGIEIDPATAISDSKALTKPFDPASTDDILPGSSSDAATPDDSHRCSDFSGPIRLISTKPEAIFTVGSSKHQSRRYRGTLEIEGGETLTAVDELPLEDYIRGVIPIEVPKGFQPEAQKALVIAIRTYALTSIGGGHHRSAGFDLCDNTDCQCFAGASKDAAWIDKLVDDTRGQVIVYNGSLIHATYSTDCGGITRNNEDAGFGKDPWPYLRSVVDSPLIVASDQATVQSAVSTDKPQVGQASATDPSADYCSGDPYHTWTKEFTADELDRIFSRSHSTKIGKFVSMEFSDFDSSGRVKSVRIKGDAGEATINGNRFRDLAGRDGLRSTRMTLTLAPDGKYVITGKGFGHGVGLCAFGANGMAKSDPRMTCFDILKHYYTGVEVKSLTGELLSKTKTVAPKQKEPVRKTKSTNHGDGPVRPGSLEESNPYDF